MGGSSSRRIEPPRLKNAEIQEFSRQSLFSTEIIEKIYGHFYRIASSQHDDGVIDLNEFCLIIHKSHNRSSIVEGLFNLFDANHDGVINFREFLQGISTYNNEESFECKAHESSPVFASKLKHQIDVSVRIINANQWQKVYIADVQKVLTSAVKENPTIKLSEEGIELIIRKTFEEEKVERDEFGKFISFDNYSKMIYKNPSIVSWLAVDKERITQDVYKKGPKRSKSRCISA